MKQDSDKGRDIQAEFDRHLAAVAKERAGEERTSQLIEAFNAGYKKGGKAAGEKALHDKMEELYPEAPTQP